MTDLHLSGAILQNIASFFQQMEERDRETFLWIWDQWLRCAANLRQHLAETNAAKGVFSIQALQKGLNVAVVLDVEEAEFRAGVASGTLQRASYPDPGANVFRLDTTGIQVGDALVLIDGARNNPQPFVIRTVNEDSVVTEQVFESEDAASITYRVDRGALPDPDFVGCAEVFSISSTVRSIPLLATTVTAGGYTLVEGADYLVKNGHLGFYAATPRQHEDRLSFFFAPEVYEDEDLPYRIFGYPIGFRRESSPEYVRGLQALWFALWSGPTPKNVGVGVSVIFGLPFATPGTVTRVMQRSDLGWEVEIEGSETVVHSVPPGFSPNVKEGDQVGFQSLTDAARVVDYVSDPTFVGRFGLEPSIVKFHTFFVLIQHAVLRKAYELGVPDIAAVADFVQRIKDIRTDFYLLIELPIRDEARASAEPPLVDAVIRPAAEVGPNWANRMRIDHFASPGLAAAYGYRDNYVVEARLSASVVAARDSDDLLTLTYDESEGMIRPESGALGPERYYAELSCSTRLSGSLSPGVWTGNPVLLSKASFPSWQGVKPGDVLFLAGSTAQRNIEPYTISEVQDLNLSFGLLFDRTPLAEDGLTFVIRRLYEITENETGDTSTIKLAAAKLVQDGLDTDAPGDVVFWRRWIGGEAMRQDYEAAQDTGRYDFSDPEARAPLLMGADALQLVDRVKITSYEVDDTEKAVYDERDDIGDPRP